MRYPYELEWLEGAMVDSVQWILEGHPLYSAPSAHFIPTVYNPVYFYAAAAFTRLLGSGFLALRLVSVLSTIGIAALLIRFLAPKNRSVGLVAAGLYIASFRFSGAWMDIAKTDSLCLFVVLLAHFVGQRARTSVTLILSGALYSLGYFVKQGALPIAAMVVAGQLLLYRRGVWMQGVAMVGVTLATFFWLDRISDGWYSFYTFDSVVHFARTSDPGYFWRMWGAYLPPASLVAAFGVASLVDRSRRLSVASVEAASARPALGHVASVMRVLDAVRKDDELIRLWRDVVLAVALVASSWLVFLERGTYDNGLMPACLGLAMLCALAYDQARGRVVRFGAVAFLIVLQFVLFRFNPLAQLPTRADRRAGDHVIARVRELPGEVLFVQHGFYNRMAGKNAYFHDVNVNDSAGWASEGPNGESDRRRRDLVAQSANGAIFGQVFDWVITDAPNDNLFPYYLFAHTMIDEPGVFYTLTGKSTRPESLLMRNPVARGGELALDDPKLNSLFVSGWGEPEGWGRWVEGTRATLAVVLESGRAYSIDCEVASASMDPQATQSVAVRWNGDLLGRYALSAREPELISARLPSDLVDDGPNGLQFEFAYARPIPEPGREGDSRALAARFTKIRFTQASPE
jgi:hypothetical protein